MTTFVRCSFLFFVLFVSISPIFAQQGFGMRFATNLNRFPRNEEIDLVPGMFTTGQFGLFYRKYNAYGGVEVGLNAIYKNGRVSGGFPNVPIVMRDYKTGQKVGVTALETSLLVGPRIGSFNPKTGYLFGFYLEQRNWLTVTADSIRLNKFYINIPFGGSFDFFTGFGTVGVGAYYNVGLLNVRHRPNGWKPTPIIPEFIGGKQHSVNLEITVSFNSRNQGEYFNPEIERERMKRKRKSTSKETPEENSEEKQE